MRGQFTHWLLHVRVVLFGGSVYFVRIRAACYTFSGAKNGAANIEADERSGKNVDDWYTFFFARENFESRRDLAYTSENFKLEKARSLYRLAREPAKDARFLHAAGTNGKGSTCFFLEQGLLAGSLCAQSAAPQPALGVGLFMSPHLESACERIRIQGHAVGEDDMRWAAARLALLIPSDAGGTCFEMLFLAALLIFEKHACSWIILETGIGGRLDATNIITPELCIITPIALDHTALLGTGLAAIAREKAGIIKAGVPTVSARQEPSAGEVIRARCLEVNAPYHESAGYSAHEFGFAGTLLTRADGTEWQTKMLGSEQAANLDLALTALALLAPDSAEPQGGEQSARTDTRIAAANQPDLPAIPVIPTAAADPPDTQAPPAPAKQFEKYIIDSAGEAHAREPSEKSNKSGAMQTSGTVTYSSSNYIYNDERAAREFRARLLRESLPARLEYLAGQPACIIDGAHNPHALARLAAFVGRRRGEGLVGECIVIAGMMADKDIAGNMRILEGFAAALILTALPLERAASTEELAQHVSAKTKVEYAKSPAEALARAKTILAGIQAGAHNQANPLLVIAGSFALAGALRAELRADLGA